MPSASAQTARDWTLSAKDREAIGLVVVETRRPSTNGPASKHVEHATGFVLSDSGRVLTAGHILSAADYEMCTGSANADGSGSCRIAFLRRGDPAQRFDLRVVGGLRHDDADYLVLQLPDPRDSIDQAAWSKLTLARSTAAGQPIFAVGYVGSDVLKVGGSNGVGVSPGVLRADVSGPCTNSYGQARFASAAVSPGYSGGPVLDSLHRVVGITLGEACSESGIGDAKDAPRSRVLLVDDMHGLCDGPKSPCFFGWPTDIYPDVVNERRPWSTRLVGGPAVVDTFTYGWKLGDVARLFFPGPVFMQLANDAELVQSVRADADSGSELAIVYDAVWTLSKPFTPPGEATQRRTRLFDLADTGYEPAEHVAAVVLVSEVAPKLVSRKSAADPIVLSDVDVEKLSRAERWFRAAAAAGWTGSAFALFDGCRNRAFKCTIHETRSFLEQAVKGGQNDALRSSGMARLIGKDPVLDKKMGFSLPEDRAAAVAQLRLAATPQQNVSRNAQFSLWDPFAAGLLAYFYGGGTFRGRPVVTPDPTAAAQYLFLCNQSGVQAPLQFEFCSIIYAVNSFNSAENAQSRQSAWIAVAGLSRTGPIGATIGRNLLTWSSDGSDLDRIVCEIGSDLTFAMPAAPSALVAKTAYCGEPKPNVR